MFLETPHVMWCTTIFAQCPIMNNLRSDEEGKLKGTWAGPWSHVCLCSKGIHPCGRKSQREHTCILHSKFRSTSSTSLSRSLYCTSSHIWHHRRLHTDPKKKKKTPTMNKKRGFYIYIYVHALWISYVIQQRQAPGKRSWGEGNKARELQSWASYLSKALEKWGQKSCRLWRTEQGWVVKFIPWSWCHKR